MRSFASGDVRAKISSLALSQELVELALAHLIQLRAGDDRHPVACDADPARDLGGRQPVVACDDEDPDSRLVAAGNRLCHLRPWGIEENDQAEQAQIALGVLPPLGWRRAVRKAPACDGQHAQPLRRIAFDREEHPLPVALGKGHVVVRPPDRAGAAKHLLRRPLRMHGDAPVLAFVNR